MGPQHTVGSGGARRGKPTVGAGKASELQTLDLPHAGLERDRNGRKREKHRSGEPEREGQHAHRARPPQPCGEEQVDGPGLEDHHAT